MIRRAQQLVNEPNVDEPMQLARLLREQVGKRETLAEDMEVLIHYGHQLVVAGKAPHIVAYEVTCRLVEVYSGATAQNDLARMLRSLRALSALQVQEVDLEMMKAWEHLALFIFAQAFDATTKPLEYTWSSTIITGRAGLAMSLGGGNAVYVVEKRDACSCASWFVTLGLLDRRHFWPLDERGYDLPHALAVARGKDAMDALRERRKELESWT